MRMVGNLVEITSRWRDVGQWMGPAGAFPHWSVVNCFSKKKKCRMKNHPRLTLTWRENEAGFTVALILCFFCHWSDLTYRLFLEGPKCKVFKYTAATLNNSTHLSIHLPPLIRVKVIVVAGKKDILLFSHFFQLLFGNIKALWGLMGYIIPPAWFSVGRKVYSLLEVVVFIVMDVS